MRKTPKKIFYVVILLAIIFSLYCLIFNYKRPLKKYFVKNPSLIVGDKKKSDYAEKYVPIVKIGYTSLGITDKNKDQISANFTEVKEQNLNKVIGDEALINIAGDIIPEADLQVAAEINNGYDHVLKNIKPYIEDGDVNIVNLETTIVSSKPYEGLGIKFNASSLLLDALKRAGFNMLLTANNHAMDEKDSGYIETIENISDVKLKSLGSYKNAMLNEDSGNIVNVKGMKIGFLNFTLLSNFKPQKTGLLNYIANSNEQYDEISSKAQKLKNNGAEIVILLIHWGSEYHIYPRKNIYSLAQKLVNNNIDVIVGGHPHVIQPYQIVKSDDNTNKFISYSIGNFVSHQRGIAKYGLINKLYIGRNSDNKVVVSKVEPLILKVDVQAKEYNNLNSGKSYTYIDYIIKADVLDEYNKYRCKNIDALGCN